MKQIVLTFLMFLSASSWAKPPVSFQLREMSNWNPQNYYLRGLLDGGVVVSKRDGDQFFFDFYTSSGNFRGSVEAPFYTNEIYALTNDSIVAMNGSEAYIVNLQTNQAVKVDSIRRDYLYAQFEVTKGGQFWGFHYDFEKQINQIKIFDSQGSLVSELEVDLKVWKTTPLENGSVLLTNFIPLAKKSRMMIVDSRGTIVKNIEINGATFVRVVPNKVFVKTLGDHCEGREYNETGDLTSARPDFCGQFHFFGFNPIFVANDELIATLGADNGHKNWLLRYDYNGRLKKKTVLKNWVPGKGSGPWLALSNAGFARGQSSGIELYDLAGNYLKTFSPNYYSRLHFLSGDSAVFMLGKIATIYDLTDLP